MVRVTRLELVRSVWKTDRLPLNLKLAGEPTESRTQVSGFGDQNTNHYTIDSKW